MKKNRFGYLCGKPFLAIVLVACCALVLTGCNPKISTNISKSYPTTAYDQQIAVIPLEQEIPAGAEVLGEVKIGDNGFTATANCTYSKVLEDAKLEARKAGGNAIKITEHKLPTAMGSSCHRITASILHLENPDAYLAKAEDVIADVDYAILNVYRFSGVGPAVSYDLHLGDEVVCRVKNNFKKSIQIKTTGAVTIWAKTEAKSEIPITIEPGHTYYVRCSVTMGAFVGHPLLELVDYQTGKSEFETFNAKNQ